MIVKSNDFSTHDWFPNYKNTFSCLGRIYKIRPCNYIINFFHYVYKFDTPAHLFWFLIGRRVGRCISYRLYFTYNYICTISLGYIVLNGWSHHGMAIVYLWLFNTFLIYSLLFLFLLTPKVAHQISLCGRPFICNL